VPEKEKEATDESNLIGVRNGTQHPVKGFSLLKIGLVAQKCILSSNQGKFKKIL
jgi:hypothetical protein